MYILRRNKDNEIVVEQAKCPTPDQIVTAAQNEMTWRCNDFSEQEKFFEATSRALAIAARYNRKMRTVTLRGPINNVDVAVPEDRELETMIIKYCGEYYGNPTRSRTSKTVFHTVELYEINIS